MTGRLAAPPGRVWGWLRLAACNLLLHIKDKRDRIYQQDSCNCSARCQLWVLAAPGEGKGRFCTFCMHTLLWCQNQEHVHLRLSADFHTWSGAGRGQWSSLLHSGTFFASAHQELWAGEVSARGTLSAVFGVKATPSPDVTASNPGAAL